MELLGQQHMLLEAPDLHGSDRPHLIQSNSARPALQTVAWRPVPLAFTQGTWPDRVCHQLFSPPPGWRLLPCGASWIFLLLRSGFSTLCFMTLLTRLHWGPPGPRFAPSKGQSRTLGLQGPAI